jgi:hypothetical protein
MLRGTNLDDFFTSIERSISSSEAEGEEHVTLETGDARFLLACARHARKEGPGRKVISQHAKKIEGLILSRARQRKAELIAASLPKEQAEEQAAEEASAEFGKSGRNLAPSTIKRRMQHRR